MHCCKEVKELIKDPQTIMVVSLLLRTSGYSDDIWDSSRF